MTVSLARRSGTRGVVAALLPVALAAAGCDVGAPARTVRPADSAAGESRFRLVGLGGAALVVPVYVNGQGPFDFIMDTGATLTCVAQPLARRLALREEPLNIGIGVGIGGAGRVGMVRLDSLRVGEARAAGLPACVLDLQGLSRMGAEVHGLVGLNFLRRFTVTLDFERQVVRLE